MSDTIQKMFSDISPTYDKLNHFLSLNIDKSWRRQAISLIPYPKNKKIRILDLCAGTFDLSLECLKQFPNAQITAADFSQEMLDAGTDKIRVELEKGNIKPVCCDALDMPMENNFFDVIVCGYGVRNFDNTTSGVREIYRVLKPGGHIIVLDFFKPTERVSKFFHNTYAKFIMPTCGKLISGHKSAYHYLKESIQGFLTKNEFKDLLEENNYTDVVTMDFLLSISTAIRATKTEAACN